MKKAYLFIFCLLVFFTACEQSTVFYDISQEIKLETQTIKGTVYSMRKIDSTLYAANGMLNQKSMEANKWSKISVPNKEIVTVAYGKNENAKYLYILGNPKDTEIIILPGCNHGNGMYKQTELYQGKIKEFINNVIGEV